MKYIVFISRIFTGIIFTFSGFVKIIDPLGFTYKIGDYFADSFAMPSLDVFSFPLAFGLAALEFIIGVALLLNIKPRLTTLVSLFFMIVFLPLTFYIAMVPSLKSWFPETFSKINDLTDCGCFGDAIVMTNWQTFYKNLVIIIPVLIIFFYRKKMKPYFSSKKQWLILLGIIIATIGFETYNLWHLPVIDFRPYAVGNHLPDLMKIPEGMPTDVYKVYYTLENTETGEKIKIDSEEYMNNEIYWDDPWTITETSDPVLVEKGYTPPIHDLTIVSKDGIDITDDVLNNEGYYFWLVSYNINDANTSNQDKINKIAEYCMQNNIGFICLTASIDEHIEQYKNKTHAPFDFYNTDEITLKTIIRSNPGLVLLKNGTVIAKWHYNDIPDIEKLKSKYLKL
ncbi:MAG: DoxX family protein [Marinilabiliales bacterium]